MSAKEIILKKRLLQNVDALGEKMSDSSVLDIKKFMTMTSFDGSPEECKNSHLHTYFKNHNNYMSSKWEHYISIYSKLFIPFISDGKPINLLEIGIANGGSLEIWQNILPLGSHIYGVDVKSICAEAQYNEYIKVLIGDISKGELIDNELKNIIFDVVIDDASHFFDNILANFNNTFEKLNLGGLYIIEDCHASYWKEFGGSLHKSNSTINHFKKLIDVLNYTYFKDIETLNDSERAFYEKYHPQIASISFYDSVIVIEKYAKLKKKPFRNFLFGNYGSVYSKGSLLEYGHLECKSSTKFEKFYRD